MGMNIKTLPQDTFLQRNYSLNLPSVLVTIGKLGQNGSRRPRFLPPGGNCGTGVLPPHGGVELDQPDQRDRRIRDLEERLSRLSEASLRINESLDFDTVLQEAVDNARALTASRYGAITVLGEAGQTPEFIVSGVMREERQGLWDLPLGQAIFENLSGLELPQRVSKLMAPILHYGVESAPSTWPMTPATGSSPARTRRRWRSSPPRRPRPSPTPGGTGRSGGAPALKKVETIAISSMVSTKRSSCAYSCRQSTWWLGLWPSPVCDRYAGSPDDA